MTAAVRHVGAGREPTFRLTGRRHPEWWVVPLVVAAWLVLAAATVASITGGAPASAGYAAIFVCPIVTPAGTEASGASSVIGLFEAPLMVVAMMVPLVLPALHHVGISGLWARRQRGPALVLVGFVGTWIPLVWALDLAVGLVAGTVGPIVAVVGTAALAIVWQRAATRQRALRGCTRSVPLPPRGRRADLACLAYGVLLGRSCGSTCLALMGLVAAAGHGLVAMAAIASVLLYERQVRGPRPRHLPALLVIVGVAAVAVAQTSA